jgi:UDPglucose 6-dehydrogenase
MKVAVVGTGYVGLVTATCLAESGNDVTGVDKDASKIATLKAGKLPIYEPGLLELVQRNVREGRLNFGTDLAAAAVPAKVIFLAVGTPQSPEGAADLSAVWAVGNAIAAALKSKPEAAAGKIIVTKSTVPVGTNRALAERLAAAGCPAGVEVVSNPEFLKEGAAVDDFMKPDRVVVGVRKPEAAEVMKELYAPFLRTERPFLVMSPESAEMTKYAANGMLATKISFINEMANLCDRVGADINDVRRGIGHDQRIGFQFLFPGPGYGGSCFPKDVNALIHTGKEHDVPLTLMEAVDRVNEAQKQVLARKVRSHYGEKLAGKTLAVWGLAFKPRTDDVREAPALSFIDAMLHANVRLRVHDPEALTNVRQMYGEKICYSDRPYGALEGADGLVIVTEWPEFRNPDFEVMRRLMTDRVVFDGRNIFEPKHMEKLGFKYYAIGRG